MLGLHCCSGFSLLVVASLIAEHGPWGRKAGEFFTTEPQGKPHWFFISHTSDTFSSVYVNLPHSDS